MNTRVRRVGCIVVMCGVIGFGIPASAQNRAGGSTEVVLMTGPNEAISVTLPVGTTRPERPYDWARLLFRRVKEGAVTPKQALLAIAWLPAPNRNSISGSAFLGIEESLFVLEENIARMIDPDSEKFNLLAGLASLGLVAVPSLLDTISKDQPLVSTIALSILDKIGPLKFTFAASAQVIFLLLDNPDPSVRRRAAKSLTNVADSLVTAAVRASRKALIDEDMLVRAAAAVALTKMDPTSTEGVSTMVAELQRPANRFAAADALAEMGERAASAGQPLVNLMISNDTKGQHAAIYALGKIGAPIVPQVVTLLDAKNEQHWQAAGAVLIRIGKPSVQAVLDRLDKIRDSKEATFVPVISTLIGLGEHAVPSLIENLRYRDEPRAVWSAFALGGIGRPAMTAVPALTMAARSANIALRQEATEALKKIQSR